MIKIIYEKISGHARQIKNHPLARNKNLNISYKNITMLNQYLSEGRKIISSRITLIDCKKQKKLAKAIKIKRILAL